MSTHDNIPTWPPEPRIAGSGGLAFTLAAGLGVVGTALAIIGLFTGGAPALGSYLTAFMFWLGISLGLLGWLGAFWAAKARWPIVMRRVLEHGSMGIVPLLLLMIPIFVGMKSFYPWFHPETLTHEQQKILEHRHVWNAPVFFWLRFVFYFGYWIICAWFLRAWSLRQDKDGELINTVKARMLGPGMLPMLGLAITFFAFDWIMSLQVEFFSTMFGMYYIAESILASISVLIIVVFFIDRAGAFGNLIRPSHWHAMGKYLLAFTCFWAYVAFSQFMLIWVANLPEEIHWYTMRSVTGGQSTPWISVAVFLAFGHFLFPFIVMLQRDLKRRGAPLFWLAVWQLAGCFVDVYWMIAPQVQKTATPHWTLIPALVGIGGLVVAFALFIARGKSLIPAKDPYLFESLRYDK